MVAAAAGCDNAPSGEAAVGASEPAAQSSSNESRLSVLPAGEASLALGVSHWEIGSSGVARGVDAAGAVVAQFRLDSATRTVESVLPDRGIRRLDGAARENTMSARAGGLLDSFLGDMKAEVQKVQVAQPITPFATGVYGCFANYLDCDSTGAWGIYQGWWNNYNCYVPTTWCGRSVALVFQY
jgi:hypothetical protein